MKSKQNATLINVLGLRSNVDVIGLKVWLASFSGPSLKLCNQSGEEPGKMA